MADADIAGAVKAALARVEIPGGGALADYTGLSDIIVTKSAVALAISVQPGMRPPSGRRVSPRSRRPKRWPKAARSWCR